jgi:HEAT repeat protein
VIYRNGIIAIDGSVPVTTLRSHTGAADQPTTPHELAAWVNQLLRLKPYKGVSPKHEGIFRLSRWVANRLEIQNRSIIRKTEMLEKARQWLPEYFESVVVDPKSLHAHHRTRMIDVDIDHDSIATKERECEDEAIEHLIDERPKRRIKGLSILARVEDPDLFDWCAMLLDDESEEVRVAALHTMLQSDDGDPEIIVPLAQSEDRRVRGAAIAAIAKHSGRSGARWVEFGLKDPSPCVRVATAAVLAHFDPCRHRKIFELALHDPNHDVARRAKALKAGKSRRRTD